MNFSTKNYITQVLLPPILIPEKVLTGNSKLTILSEKHPTRSIKHWDPANLKYFQENRKTPTSSRSLPSLFVYETPITELKENIIGDTCRSEEKKVNLLNIEVIV